MSAHGRTHWIKLYIEMNHDPKIGLLTDDLKWRFVSVLLLAGEVDDGGFLPEINDMAWQLHAVPETIAGQMRTLAQRGLVELRPHPDGDERWFVSRFAARQAPSSNAERQRNWRQRNATVTKSYAEVTPETEYRIQNTETEGGEKSARPIAPRKPSKASPPPVVKSQPIDRTPGGNGYRPAAEPPPKAKEPPPPDVAAIGELANAITDVTGISARLNWDEVGGLAEDLHRAGYTAEQVRAHYSRRKVAEHWHWYESDWRGKKGDKPRIKEIRETIAGAVTDRPGQPDKESGQSWLEQSLKLARANGLLPGPDR